MQRHANDKSTRTRFEYPPTGNARSVRKKEPWYKKWMQSNVGNERGRETVSKDLPCWISCWLSAGVLSALFSRYPFKAAVNLCYANTDFHGKTSRERKSDISLCLAEKNIKFALCRLVVDRKFHRCSINIDRTWKFTNKTPQIWRFRNWISL